MREAVDLPDQRRHQHRHRLKHAADTPDLGRAARADDQAGGLPLGHQRTGKGHRGAVAQRRVDGNGPFPFFRRDGFAGERGFLDGETSRLEQAQVGRDAVSRLQQHDVSRHEIRHIDRGSLSPSQRDGVGRQQRAHAVQRFLRPPLLHEADDGIDHHHQHDDRCVHRMPQQERRQSCRDQEIDQRIVKLHEEAPQGMHARGFGEAIGSILPQTRCRLFVRKTPWRGAEFVQHLPAVQGVPRSLGHRG